MKHAHGGHRMCCVLCASAFLHPVQAADDEDAMLAAAIAASLQDAPAPAQHQQQARPQQPRAQQTAAGGFSSISHPPAAAGQTPSGGSQHGSPHSAAGGTGPWEAGRWLFCWLQSFQLEPAHLHGGTVGHPAAACRAPRCRQWPCAHFCAAAGWLLRGAAGDPQRQQLPVHGCGLRDGEQPRQGCGAAQGHCRRSGS